MSERVRNGNRHTQLLHAQRMHRLRWPSQEMDIRTALAIDPSLRDEIRRQLSDKAKKAEKRLNRIYSNEEWFDIQDKKGCI